MQNEHNISEELAARPTDMMDQVSETADLLNEVCPSLLLRRKTN